MDTKPEKKEQLQNDDKQPAKPKKPEEGVPQEDMFSLDSDIEIEGLVESINHINQKERTLKK